MKSGLEDRNNCFDPESIPDLLLTVSMKSGLEDRNNGGGKAHEFPEPGMSQ